MSEQDEVLAALADAIPSGGDWLRAECPFCPTVLGKADKRRSFGININSGYFHCFKCRSSGRLHESNEWTPVEESKKPEPESVDVGPPEQYVPIGFEPAKSSLAFSPVIEYLLKRGICSDTIRNAKIGACIGGKYGGRVIVPIFADDDDTWLGFSARDWTNTQELRYRYPAGMQRGTIMYQHRILSQETDEPALIVEGVFDALPYFGVAAACLGKPSRWQIAAMEAAKRPVAVVLDGDAWEEAWALAQRLKFKGVRAGSVKLPAGKDPNTVDKEWLLEKAAECVK